MEFLSSGTRVMSLWGYGTEYYSNAMIACWQGTQGMPRLSLWSPEIITGLIFQEMFITMYGPVTFANEQN